MSSCGASLPGPLTSFVGRDAELARLAEILSSGSRLVTLLGPAGIGKTRLAVRYAELCGGVAFCDLSTAKSLDDLCNVVARGLEIALGSTTTSEALVERVGAGLAAQANPLVILDNCEHIVEHAARALGAWTLAAQTTRFLATSRELLGIAGEQAYEVLPLKLPSSDEDDEAEAVRLFMDRARLVRQDRTATLNDAHSIAALVRQLEGLPLAIELAAGCTDLFTPAELLARAPRRLDELESRARMPAERHRTLRAAIDGSWQLLRPWEQAALAQCTAFRGGFSLKSAEAVIDLEAWDRAPSLVHVLAALRGKSLLRVFEPKEARGQMRFGLYESIRAYAEEQLVANGWEPATVARHAAYFEHLATVALGPHAEGVTERDRILALELDNLHAAHRGALAASPPRVDAALRVALAVDPVLRQKSALASLLALLSAALDRVDSGHDRGLVARALVARARVRQHTGPFEAVRPELERALALAEGSGDAAAAGRALAGLAVLDYSSNSMAGALASFERALTMLRRGGDVRGEAGTLVSLGNTELWLGGADKAKEHLEQAIECAERVGDMATKAYAVTCLARVLASAGELGDALACVERAVDAADGSDNPYEGARAMDLRAWVLQEQGREEEARAAYEEACTVHRRLGDTLGVGENRGYYGRLLHERGDLEGAVACYKEAVECLSWTGFQGNELLFRACLGAALAALGRRDAAASELDRAETALRQHNLLSQLQVVDLLRGLLDLALARGHEDEGDPVLAERLRDRARARLTTMWPSPPADDSHFARRLLTRALEREASGATDGASPCANRLLIGRRAEWLVLPSGERVELPGQRPVRLILLALARQRLSQPGKGLTGDELLAHGWPDEAVMPLPGINRVRVALSRLRKLGLRDLLLTQDDGYALSAAVPLVFEGVQGGGG